jgi:hypothetical protein
MSGENNKKIEKRGKSDCHLKNGYIWDHLERVIIITLI